MCVNAHNIRTESYIGLCHGTDNVAAQNIIATQEFRPSKAGWCGTGIYFYDIKSKAYWSAERTCHEKEKDCNRKFKPAVVYVDIVGIPNQDICDLRSFKEIEGFAAFVNAFLSESPFEIDEDMPEEEKLECKRLMLLALYAKEKNKKLIIGVFSQRMRKEYQNYIEFSREWKILFGIETIYCVRDPSIISNIRDKIS